jgi:hypothetical protein
MQHFVADTCKLNRIADGPAGVEVGNGRLVHRIDATGYSVLGEYFGSGNHAAQNSSVYCPHPTRLSLTPR